MPLPLTERFIFCSGALLIFLGSIAAISNFELIGNVPLRDPFDISVSLIFWIFAVATFLTGVICLFGENSKRQLVAIFWVSATFEIYRIALLMNGVVSLRGYLGRVASAFNISPAAAVGLLEVAFATILVGSLIAIFGTREKAPLHGPSCA